MKGEKEGEGESRKSMRIISKNIRRNKRQKG
jgi:hypothetical protein